MKIAMEDAKKKGEVPVMMKLAKERSLIARDASFVYTESRQGVREPAVDYP